MIINISNEDGKCISLDLSIASDRDKFKQVLQNPSNAEFVGELDENLNLIKKLQAQGLPLTRNQQDSLDQLLPLFNSLTKN